MSGMRHNADDDVMFKDIITLMNLMPVGIRWMNRGGRCEYVNRTFVEMFGYPLEEISIIDDWFICAYPDPDYRQGIIDWYSEIIQTLDRGSTPPPLQASITCKDGSERHVIISAHVAMGRVIGIYTDISEIAKAEQLQLEIEKMFRLTFESTRDAIFWTNAESGILVNCNRAAEEMIEVTRIEIIGRHFTCLHPADRKEQSMALFEKMATIPGPVDDAESEIISRSGRRIPVLIRNSMTRIGETYVIQGIFLDISEQKRTEKALTDSCTLLQKTLSSLNESVFIVESGTNIILDCNIKVEMMFGYTRDELIGESTSCLHLSEEMSCSFDEEMQKGYQQLGYFETEYMMVRKDGTTFFSEHFVNPIKDEQGVIVKHVCVVRDISRRKQAEEALRKSESKYRAMIEAFDGYLYICSQDKRVEFMNRQMIERTGYDATGEFCYKALHDLESVCPWCVNEQVFMGESIQWELQSPKDGRWYHISNTPIRNTDGITSKQAMITDITARKQAEQDRVALETQKMINEEQRQFLGLISHEVRTPLAVIDGAAQLILLTSSPEMPCFPQADRIRTATTRLKDLIDTCLTEERLSTTGWSPEMQEQDISLIVKSAAEQAQAMTLRHSIESLIENLCWRFTCDQVLIKIMLSNLLDNAIKYSPAGGGIVVRLYGKENVICIDVSDQGVGIQPDKTGKIFERFFRIWQIPGVAGAGLGLSLVKRIAEIHGGSVTCHSIPGSGSTFTVTLPNNI